MAIEVEIECDGQHHGSGYNSGTINTGDAVYCEDCYTHLEGRVEELEENVKGKDEKIEELEEQLADLQSEE